MDTSDLGFVQSIIYILNIFINNQNFNKQCCKKFCCVFMIILCIQILEPLLGLFLYAKTKKLKIINKGLWI